MNSIPQSSQYFKKKSHGKEPIDLESCMKKPFSLKEWEVHNNKKLKKKLEESQKYNGEMKGPLK